MRVVDYLPAPTDVLPIQEHYVRRGVTPKDEEPSQPAFFKIMVWLSLGYSSGLFHVKEGSVLNSCLSDKKERISPAGFEA